MLAADCGTITSRPVFSIEAPKPVDIIAPIKEPMTNLVTQVTQGTSEQTQAYLKYVLPSAGALILTIISVGLAHAMAKKREAYSRRQKARDEIFTVIARIESELETCENLDSRTNTVHSNSVTPLRNAIFGLKPFIKGPAFEKVLAILREYQGYDANPRSTMEKIVAHDLRGGAPSQEPQYPADAIRSYLKKIREIV